MKGLPSAAWPGPGSTCHRQEEPRLLALWLSLPAAGLEFQRPGIEPIGRGWPCTRTSQSAPLHTCVANSPKAVAIPPTSPTPPAVTAHQNKFPAPAQQQKCCSLFVQAGKTYRTFSSLTRFKGKENKIPVKVSNTYPKEMAIAPLLPSCLSSGGSPCPFRVLGICSKYTYSRHTD